MVREPHIYTPAQDGRPLGLLPLMSATIKSTEQPVFDPEPDSEVAILKKQLDNLQAHVGKLIDEKAELTQANNRLAETVKALNIEKSNLQAELKKLQGMGIQQNDPDTFTELKAKA